mmetsp:Transcript_611/g.1024  ORF Transcript_611/g.1024 Transcript_611/m.1024 type:complete len:115 (+) Transcript_611:1108-1452(+)
MVRVMKQVVLWIMLVSSHMDKLSTPVVVTPRNTRAVRTAVNRVGQLECHRVVELIRKEDGIFGVNNLTVIVCTALSGSHLPTAGIGSEYRFATASRLPGNHLYSCPRPTPLKGM